MPNDLQLQSLVMAAQSKYHLALTEGSRHMSTAKAGARSHITVLTILGELLTVIGPIGVLGLWLYQQTENERNSIELRRIASARSLYQTYQPNNALFNAINEALGGDKDASERLRSYQIHNYELGLVALEDVLSKSEKQGIPLRTDAYGSGDFSSKVAHIQQRADLLHGRINEKEMAIRTAIDSAQSTYFWIFVGLSLLTIVGAIGKGIQKLSSDGRS